MAQRQDERRSEAREPADVEIRFRYPDVFRARLLDFCQGGLGAETPFALDEGALVEVEILDGCYLAQGHVRWVDLEEERVRIGVRFHDEDRLLISEIRRRRKEAS